MIFFFIFSAISFVRTALIKVPVQTGYAAAKLGKYCSYQRRDHILRVSRPIEIWRSITAPALCDKPSGWTNRLPMSSLRSLCCHSLKFVSLKPSSWTRSHDHRTLEIPRISNRLLRANLLYLISLLAVAIIDPWRGAIFPVIVRQTKIIRLFELAWKQDCRNS